MLSNHLKLDQFLADHSKKTLIFDFDETLFKLHLPWGEYVQNTHALLAELVPEAYHDQIHKDQTTFDVINAFTKEFGPEIRDRCLEYAREFETKQLEGYVRNDQLVEWVKQHQNQYQFFIWSSNLTTTIQPILEAEGLSEVFQQIIGRDTVRFTKPHPDGFELIQAEADAPDITEYLMIGNSQHSDGGAAENSGIDFCLIKYFTRT